MGYWKGFPQQLWKTFLVYRTPLKGDFCGENAGVSGSYICLHKTAIHPESVSFPECQLQLLALQSLAHIADGEGFHGMVFVVSGGQQIADPV